MEQIPAAGNINHKFALRLQTVLHRADGNGTTDIAALWGIHPMTVSLYGKRYNERCLDALVRDTTRKPGKASLSNERKSRLCRITGHENPNEQPHWSTRSLGACCACGCLRHIKPGGAVLSNRAEAILAWFSGRAAEAFLP
jgi:hypothetical protein